VSIRFFMDRGSCSAANKHLSKFEVVCKPINQSLLVYTALSMFKLVSFEGLGTVGLIVESR
jgi:hypothetical protein